MLVSEIQDLILTQFSLTNFKVYQQYVTVVRNINEVNMLTRLIRATIY